MGKGKRLGVGGWLGCCCLLIVACDNTIEETIPLAPPIVEELVVSGTPCDQYIHLFEDSENPSRFLGQAEQESHCNPLAKSPVGAQGLMQFMPDTSDWAEDSFCRHLGKARPFNAAWSAACGIAYMEWFTIDLFDSYCDNKYVDEQRYNGGGYVLQELRDGWARHGELSFENAEQVCGTRLSNGKRRSLANCKENYEYPRLISKRQTKYLPLGGKYCE